MTQEKLKEAQEILAALEELNEAEALLTEALALPETGVVALKYLSNTTTLHYSNFRVRAALTGMRTGLQVHIEHLRKEFAAL